MGGNWFYGGVFAGLLMVAVLGVWELLAHLFGEEPADGDHDSYEQLSDDERKFLERFFK